MPGWFFFQAEDGIRDLTVTGVQTCALPIWMREAAQILRTRRAEYARTMTLEMGKPIVQGEAEVDKCAWVCERITPRPCSPSSRARRRPRGVTSASIPSGPCLP